jgi:hypothetical protein
MAESTTPDRRSQSEWLTIATPGPGYAGSVASLVAGISRTRSGRTLLERLRASGCPIRIERPSPPTNPPNAWARLRNAGSVDAGIVVAYDPADWPNPTQQDAPAKDMVLLRLFEHALALASGTASSVTTEPSVSATMEAYLRERNGDA